MRMRQRRKPRFATLPGVFVKPLRQLMLRVVRCPLASPNTNLDAQYFRILPEAVMTGPVPQLSPQELAARLESGDDLTIIDVREPWELERASLPNAMAIPLGEIPGASATLDASRSYVLVCHHGMRSELATEWLRNHGFADVSNLDGGIDAWSMTVDPSVPRY
jgi:rhodanese-related sulfurtransferase